MNFEYLPDVSQGDICTPINGGIRTKEGEPLKLEYANQLKNLTCDYLTTQAKPLYDGLAPMFLDFIKENPEHDYRLIRSNPCILEPGNLGFTILAGYQGGLFIDLISLLKEDLETIHCCHDLTDLLDTFYTKKGHHKLVNELTIYTGGAPKEQKIESIRLAVSGAILIKQNGIYQTHEKKPD